MKILLDIFYIKNYNWCSFTIERLIETFDGWKHNQGNYFCGPMIFLVVIYVRCSFFFWVLLSFIFCNAMMLICSLRLFMKLFYLDRVMFKIADV